MPFTTRSLCIVTPIFSPVFSFFILWPLFLSLSNLLHRFISHVCTFHFRLTCLSPLSLPFMLLIVRLALSLAVCRIHIVSLKWWLLFTLSSHLAPTTASLLTTQIKALNTQELFIPSPTNLPVILFLSSLPHILILCHCVPHRCTFNYMSTLSLNFKLCFNTIIWIYMTKKRYWALLSMASAPHLINQLVLPGFVHQPLQVTYHMAFLGLWCTNITYSPSLACCQNLE